jgi:hypothetical protein
VKKYYDRILWITLCQQIKQLKWNGQILRHKVLKLNKKGTENMSRPVTSKEIE